MAEEITRLKIDVAVINEKLDTQGKKLDSVIRLLENHIEVEDERHEAMKTETKEKIAEAEKKIETKADKEVVDEIKADIKKVVWVLVIAIISALLNLIIKSVS